MNKKISITQGYLLIFLLSFVISMVGITYAYFSISRNNATAISGDAAMINLNLNVRKILPNTGDYIVPQRSVALESALLNGCIDSNNNIVCQVYSINIRNNGTASVILDGKIYFFPDRQMKNDIVPIMPNLKWKVISSFDENNVNNSVLGNGEVNSASSSGGVFSSDLSLNGSGERKYYIIVWVDEVNRVQYDLNGSFYGKVEFLASNGSGVTANFSGY